MDWEKVKESCLGFLRQYRYTALILLAGVLLLCVPERSQAEALPEASKTETDNHQDLQTQLTMLLSSMEGAGKVQVLLTQASGQEIIYQMDEDQKAGENSREIRRETVLITDGARAQDGLITRVDPPVYLGAVVLSQGADSAAVRLALVEAVRSATGISADKITVLKMK